MQTMSLGVSKFPTHNLANIRGYWLSLAWMGKTTNIVCGTVREDFKT
jgi:hypothetical protein